MSKQIQFKRPEACPKCGRMQLKAIHDQKYPGKEGIYRFVIYKCAEGHETPVRQLIVPQPNIPDPEWWRS